MIGAGAFVVVAAILGWRWSASTEPTAGSASAPPIPAKVEVRVVDIHNVVAAASPERTIPAVSTPLPPPPRTAPVPPATTSTTRRPPPRRPGRPGGVATQEAKPSVPAAPQPEVRPDVPAKPAAAKPDTTLEANPYVYK